MSADRLTDEQVTEVIVFMSDPIVADVPWSPIIESLAREVQASRKLEADLLKLHRRVYPEWCAACGASYPCRTRRLIEEAGL